MKIIYFVIGLISGLIVLDINLSFLGLSPLNGKNGLFLSSDIWEFVLITSLLVFSFCTANLLIKKRSDQTGTKTKTLLLALGICLILGALPASTMTELSVNGCCGSPSTGFEGVGALLMGVMVIGGIAAIIFSRKYNFKKI